MSCWLVEGLGSGRLGWGACKLVVLVGFHSCKCAAVRVPNPHSLAGKRVPRPDAAVMDAPLWCHYRKLALWVLLEGILIALSIVARTAHVSWGAGAGGTLHGRHPVRWRGSSVSLSCLSAVCSCTQRDIKTSDRAL